MKNDELMQIGEQAVKKRGSKSASIEATTTATNEEIWLPINGYTGLYEVSSHGRVKRLRTKRRCGNSIRVYQEKVLSPYTNNKGYLMIDLVDEHGVRHKNSVHRIVAEVFLEKTNKEYEVNHIDCNKKNNRVDNLEWCSKKQNVRHAYNSGLMKNSIAKAKQNIRHTLRGGGWAVLQICPTTDKIIAKHNGVALAAEAVGVNRHTIGKCCSGKIPFAAGFKWRYADER